jgi:integrase
MHAFLDEHLAFRLDIATGTAEQYRLAVAAFGRWLPRAPAFDAETAAAFPRWLRASLDAGLSPRSVRNRRQVILTLWRAAWMAGRAEVQPPLVSLPKQPRREPEAWTPAEVGRILAACDAAKASRGWGPDHWRGLVLTIYDTAARIGALLSVPRTEFRDGWLRLPAELQKQRRDTRHRLHPETVVVLESLPTSPLLFPWPLCRERIWLRFGEILDAAGLPHGRRDKFHRLRRTSYTQVYAALGAAAATQHAGHAEDLSRYYLDRRLLDPVCAAERIPRPG